MAYLFNISAGVGRNRPNYRLDVMLIQYLLNQATNKIALEYGSLSRLIRPPDHPGPLKMDGI